MADVPFQPTLPLRGATTDASTRKRGHKPFQPTLPLRGATPCAWAAKRAATRFNPRFPCGERRRCATGAGCLSSFNPRSPCGERQAGQPRSRVDRHVSTHAPLAGSDPPSTSAPTPSTCFNPRSPCGERPSTTTPTRPTTSFNPRSPCGERQGALRKVSSETKFQPTLPLRGATEANPCFIAAISVSTHAPLAGSDQFARVCKSTHYSFNPRSPCGERRLVLFNVSRK